MNYDVYKPVYIDDFKIHVTLKPKLIKLYKNDITNILLYGPEGSGKLTIAKCLINSFYNKNIGTKPNCIKINNRELKFNSSDYHFEILLNKYFNKKNFDELLLYLCSNTDINSKCKFKLIIIKNVEYIDNYSLLILKNILEKKHTIKFILITNKSNIKQFFKGFFLLLKIPKPGKTEVYNFLKNTNSINNININTMDKNVNLNTLSAIITVNSITKYIEPYNYYTNKLIILINSKKVRNIIKIRDILYELISKNYNIHFIINNIFNHLLKNISLSKKINLIELYSNINKNIHKSFKSIIHMESLLINMMNIIV
tara:strand:+ start:942 stop:1880 length:939 start_codon:yes stop_codon:yes gene_type:complete